MGSHVLLNSSFQYITPLGVKMPKLVCEIWRHGITAWTHFCTRCRLTSISLPLYINTIRFLNCLVYIMERSFISKRDTDPVPIGPMFGYTKKPGHILDKHAAYIHEVVVRNEILPGVRFIISRLLIVKAAWNPTSLKHLMCVYKYISIKPRTRVLTHWGRVTHICVGNLTTIGSDNGLSPGRRQAIIWTNARMLLMGPLWINFSEILIEIPTFSFKKMRLKVSSAKRRPFCLGLNVLIVNDEGCEDPELFALSSKRGTFSLLI